MIYYLYAKICFESLQVGDVVMVFPTSTSTSTSSGDVSQTHTDIDGGENLERHVSMG